MGMRSTSGVSIRRRWDRLWGRFTGGINGYIETGKFGSGAKGGVARGAVTVKPRAKRAGSASIASSRSGKKTTVSGAGAKVDIEAKIAAGKAAAKKDGK